MGPEHSTDPRRTRARLGRVAARDAALVADLAGRLPPSGALVRAALYAQRGVAALRRAREILAEAERGDVAPAAPEYNPFALRQQQ